MNWYKISKYRGLYNQDEGNAHRNSNLRGQQQAWQEHLDENESVEGEDVKMLIKLFQDGDMTGYTNYIEKLKRDGYSQDRINSMIARSYSTRTVNKLTEKPKPTGVSQTQQKKLHRLETEKQKLPPLNLTQLNQKDKNELV